MIVKNFSKKIRLFQKITLFLLIFPLLSCSVKEIASGIKGEKTGDKSLKNQSFSEDLNSWNSHQKINLLPHQLLPIDYLEKNNDVKGLVVFHYLGTGKTYLALGFAERYPSKNVVIFVPRFLQSHWQKNIVAYGVKNPIRYNVVSHANPEQLLAMDLRNTVLIIDESHKVINQLSSSDPKTSELYSKLYLKLKTADRILSLTGTPIYGDISDVAYHINLVSDKEVMPFNKHEFRKTFTKIDKHKSFARGHLLESHIFKGVLPTVTLQTALAITGNFATSGMFAVGSIVGPYFIKSMMPIDDMSLRSFDADKLQSISEKYVTYYGFDSVDLKDYPKKNINYQNVSYNSFQLDFLMRFADGGLSTDEIMLLQQDDAIAHSRDYIDLNNSKIQDAMKSKIGGGREIGNLVYADKNNPDQLVYPQKFVQVFAKMKESKGPIAIYSHYYHNGIVLFKQYLDAMGESGKYRILDPSLSQYAYEQIIEDYNNGKVKYLMIHPEITEGISLKGTNQLHMLEPSFNKAAQDQIIGRAVRYQSHAHLDKKLRYVDVYIWKQAFSNYDIEHMTALRKNWQENFSEVNYYSERKVIDKNADIKLISPDDRAYNSMTFLSNSIDDMSKLLKKHSIETKYNKGK